MASSTTGRYLAPTTASALKTRGTKPPQGESRLYALHARGGGLVLPGESARSSSPRAELVASSVPAARTTTTSQRLAVRVGTASIRRQRARLTPALRASLRAARCGEPPWSVAQCKSILRRFLHQMSTAPLAELRELITLDQAVAIAGLRSPNEPLLAEGGATHEVGGGASLYGQPPSSVSPSVLLCTVTFHANRAHNLTRSP